MADLDNFNVNDTIYTMVPLKKQKKYGLYYLWDIKFESFNPFRVFSDLIRRSKQKLLPPPSSFTYSYTKPYNRWEDKSYNVTSTVLTAGKVFSRVLDRKEIKKYSSIRF